MVLEGYRERLRPQIERIARPFLAWSPDRLSWLALGLAVAAAAVAAGVRWTTPLLFLPVSLLVFGAGLFDVLDGAVARLTGRASPRGDLLDHVLDRYADVVLVVGIALSGFAIPWLALLALASLLLTSYMGTQAQAVGQGRIYAGLLSRADRLVVLAVAAFLEFDWSLPWPWAPSAPWMRFHVAGIGFTVLDVAFLYFIVAGQWTAFARARRTYRALAPPS
ncbi:MAG TPA: CDP-alcohol phosphatidyltransferase family protein [Thermoplasmata archaeon]|nr:CDP-alcohol phosphatidyltransferase family protein [Thermoplasmata archaeon]